jgi:hypothetical protein
MAGKLKPLDVARETRPGKYPDGDGLYLVVASATSKNRSYRYSDAELKALEHRAKELKTRKVRQLGELVIATGADTLSANELAGALVVPAETKEAGKRCYGPGAAPRSFRDGRGEMYRQLIATRTARRRNRAARNRLRRSCLFASLATTMTDRLHTNMIFVAVTAGDVMEFVQKIDRLIAYRSRMGNTIEARRPPCGRLQSLSSPPCAWTTESAMASPRPMPPVSGLLESSSR